MNSSPWFKDPKRSMVIFTDLDGSLLDHNTYSYHKAQTALDKVKELNIPLIPVSSKTCAEIEQLFGQLHFIHPIIAENGAVIKIPPHYFIDSSSNEAVIHIGKNYDEIKKNLQTLKTRFAFRGFHQMSIDEVVSLTGLSSVDAARAQNREGSEPVLWEDSDDQLELFKNEISQRELSLTQGGRFLHIMGNNSKGQAIHTLLEIYKQHGFIPKLTLGLGDSENDVSMLREVDCPCVIKKPDGSHIQANLPNNVVRTKNIGPAGWNEFVMSVLGKQDVKNE